MNERASKNNFYDSWTDETAAIRAREVSREVYDHFRRYQEHSHKGQLEYGKWLIASLLAVHGGAIYALANLKGEVSKSQLPDLYSAAALNVAGLVFVIVAAFFAWLNFQVGERIYHRYADPNMLHDLNAWPNEEAGDSSAMTATLLVAAGFGVLSVYMFICSAVAMFQALSAA